MQKFHIEGGIPLNGEMTPSGNKNAALPILAATLMTNEPVTLHNVPIIRDVIDMRKAGSQPGGGDQGSGQWFVADCREQREAGRPGSGPVPAHPGFHLAGGPMLARTGGFRQPPPGGDVIGRRRLDTHNWPSKLWVPK